MARKHVCAMTRMPGPRAMGPYYYRSYKWKNNYVASLSLVFIPISVAKNDFLKGLTFQVNWKKRGLFYSKGITAKLDVFYSGCNIPSCCRVLWDVLADRTRWQGRGAAEQSGPECRSLSECVHGLRGRSSTCTTAPQTGPESTYKHTTLVILA